MLHNTLKDMLKELKWCIRWPNKKSGQRSRQWRCSEILQSLPDTSKL